MTEGGEAIVTGWERNFGMVPDHAIAEEETFCDGPLVVMLSMAQGTLAHGGQVGVGKPWQSPAAIMAPFKKAQLQFLFDADNDPARRLASPS